MDEKNIISHGEKFTDDYLMHYGVLGMKWGVRNAETMRKYAGRTRKAVSSGVKAIGGTLGRIGSTTAKGAKNTVKTISRKAKKTRKERKLEKERAKNAKMSRSKYRKTAENNEELRRQALLSNDPAVITRGLHTLTDDEVQTKMRRLINEQKIRSMPSTAPKSAKQLIKDTIKKSAEDRILKPLVNEAADQAKNALKSQIFGSVSKNTGIPKETLEKTAAAVEQTVNNELKSVPLSAVSPESFRRTSRYSGNYGSGGNEPVGYERYSRYNSDYSKARKVHGEW